MRKNDELDSIYYSRQWKIASVIKEARHSIVAFLLLPEKISKMLSGRGKKWRRIVC